MIGKLKPSSSLQIKNLRSTDKSTNPDNERSVCYTYNMKSSKIDGIIIKRKNIGEADRILTVLTKHKGKIQINAKGVRRIASRRSSHLELLNLVQMGIYTGKGMPLVTEAQSIDHFTELKKDLLKVGAAYHVCELVDGLCPENQENERVFTLVCQVLSDITTTTRLRPVIKQFELDLLATQGYWDEEQEIVDMQQYIENILERRLRTRRIFAKII